MNAEYTAVLEWRDVAGSAWRGDIGQLEALSSRLSIEFPVEDLSNDLLLGLFS